MAARFFSPSDNIGLREVVRDCFRLLCFRATQQDLIDLNWKHLVFGVFSTWVVGMGRYWDNPRVGLLQHLGVGSVVYIFILSALLWLIVWPLRPQHWSYLRVLAFVSLVSPPAVLYAIPVEKFLPLDIANLNNAWFLALVATWRVALLLFFLRRLGGLDWFAIAVVSLLPLTLIVVTLAVLNLERVVFDMMGGFRDPSGNDSAYFVLSVLTWFSIYLFIPFLICYVIVVIHRMLKRRESRPEKNEQGN